MPFPNSKYKEKKIDNAQWGAIETEYIYGKIIKDSVTGKKSIVFPSLKDLAEKFDVSEGYIGDRSSKGKWLLKREKYLADYKARIKEENLREIFISRNEKAGETLKQIEALSKLVNYYLGKYREVLNYKEGEDSFDFRDLDEEAVGHISIKDLKILSELIEKIQKLNDEVLKIDPQLKEDITSLNGGNTNEPSEEVKNTLKVLEKRVMQKGLSARRESKIEKVKGAEA